MAKRRKKKPCSITFHLPKEDITLNFEYHEFISSSSRDTKYKYIYFENSQDILSEAYEQWHGQVFGFNMPRKFKPSDATVRIYDEERHGIIETFMLTEVLPERSVTGPKDDKKPEERVIEFVDYRYLDKITPLNNGINDN